jgi:class 3 adenylate cyclase/tetratricopeptide (TPR) repeat protein
MAEENVTRKLAAILYADVVGYSRLTGLDEEGTHRTVAEYLDAMASMISDHGGRVVHYAGDAVLADFTSVVAAVECAVEVQNDLAARSADIPNDRKVQFRIGVNLGDVIVARDDIYGNGVNVAARLEALAEPSGICVSASVFEQVKGKLDVGFEDMGPQEVKNIAEPVRTYRVFADQELSETHASVRTSRALEFDPPDRPSIAILPFKCLGAEPDKDYIADGVRFGISATLVQLSGLFLVHAPVLNGYREKNVTATSVGSELNIRYVLEGSVQQAGNRIRVTVQLTDVDAKQIILAESYDRVLNDVFQLQDEITREVISSLNIKLVANEIDRIWFGKLNSPEAIESYYRGASHFYELNKDDNATARQMFEELYRVQPDSVVGPSYISVTHWMDAFFGWTDPSARSMEQAADWAKKAMQYKENNGIGHAVYGHIQLLDRKFNEALATCSKGTELRSSCPLAHALFGLALNYCGDSEAAVKSVKEALQLEKVYPAWLIDILAAAYRDCGDVELSILAAQESIQLNPQNNDARLILCSDYILAADQGEARRVADQVVGSDPAFSLSSYAKRQPYKNPAMLDRLITALSEAGLPN